MKEQKNLTYEELLESLNSATEHPFDTCWDIYHYLVANKDSMTEEEIGLLLRTYDALHYPKGSTLDRKMDELRPRQTQEPLPKSRTLGSEPKEQREQSQAYLNSAESRLRKTEGHPYLREMVATKVYETEYQGRKYKSVRMVAGDGSESNVRLERLACKEQKVVGKVFKAQFSTGKDGRTYISKIEKSTTLLTELFPVVLGYVHSYDEGHGHYHIFDSQSRHFVAEKPEVVTMAGDFVWFCPVVPLKSKFKSAFVISVENQAKGLAEFGLLNGKVTYINKEKGFFGYQLDEEAPKTPEGEVASTGTGNLDLCPTLAKGDKVKMLILLMRSGKNNGKHNRVIKITQIRV